MIRSTLQGALGDIANALQEILTSRQATYGFEAVEDDLYIENTVKQLRKKLNEKLDDLKVGPIRCCKI